MRISFVPMALYVICQAPGTFKRDVYGCANMFFCARFYSSLTARHRCTLWVFITLGASSLSRLQLPLRLEQCHLLLHQEDGWDMQDCELHDIQINAEGSA